MPAGGRELLRDWFLPQEGMGRTPVGNMQA